MRDVRATYRSVAVDYDPLIGDRDAIARAVASAYTVGGAPPAGRDVEIPVVYGGADGPDFAEVADRSGLSAAAVVAAHSSPTYHAFMLGFMPGFAYLGPVEAAIAAPRRATPRLRVAAGSVGIAGRQTGIYPRDCPGGWAIVGRTDAVLFDPSREPAAYVQPGDRVRFVAGGSSGADAGRRRAASSGRRRAQCHRDPAGAPDHGAGRGAVGAPGAGRAGGWLPRRVREAHGQRGGRQRRQPPRFSK